MITLPRSRTRRGAAFFPTRPRVRPSSPAPAAAPMRASLATACRRREADTRTGFGRASPRSGSQHRQAREPGGRSGPSDADPHHAVASGTRRRAGAPRVGWPAEALRLLLSWLYEGLSAGQRQPAKPYRSGRPRTLAALLSHSEMGFQTSKFSSSARVITVGHSENAIPVGQCRAGGCEAVGDSPRCLLALPPPPLLPFVHPMQYSNKESSCFCSVDTHLTSASLVAHGVPG